MPRIKYTQKVSTKLTRAEKQALSVEKWKLIQEITKINQDAEEVLKSMSTDAVREFRKNLKKTSANINAVANTLKIKLKLPNIKLPVAKTAPISFGKISRRVSTPLDIWFNEGLATSIWENISASVEGPAYWMEILSYIISKGRKDVIWTLWSGRYFNDYEQDESGEWYTDYEDGYDCLREFQAVYTILRREEQNESKGV